MMKNNNNIYITNGINLTGLLQIAFVILKLCGVIDWHWALVLLPIEIDIGIAILVLAIYWLVIGIIILIQSIKNKRIRKKLAKERLKEEEAKRKIDEVNKKHNEEIKNKLQELHDKYDYLVFNKYLPAGISKNEHYKKLSNSIINTARFLNSHRISTSWKNIKLFDFSSFTIYKNDSEITQRNLYYGVVHLYTYKEDYYEIKLYIDDSLEDEIEFSRDNFKTTFGIIVDL